MAKKYAKDYGKKAISSGLVPSGFNESYKYDQVLLSGDVIYFGYIPAGVEINAASLVHDADADASLALGYEKVDGTGDATYFLAATALATAGRKEGKAFPITFTEDVRLIGTVSAAGIADGTKLVVILNGKGVGVA